MDSGKTIITSQRSCFKKRTLIISVRNLIRLFQSIFVSTDLLDEIVVKTIRDHTDHNYLKAPNIVEGQKKPVKHDYD